MFSIAHQIHFIHLKNPYRQNILSIIFSLVFVPFPLGWICKCWFLLMKTQRVLNRSSKRINVRDCKNQAFWQVTINSKSKLKEWCYKISWWALWVKDPRIFKTANFVKNYCLNLNFFQVIQSALHKNEKKIFSKMMQDSKKLLDIARYRRKHWNKRKANEKWVKVKKKL